MFMSTIQELLIQFPIEKDEVCEDLEKGVNEFVRFNMTKDAFAFSENLTLLINEFPKFKETYPYLFERYQNLILKIKWLNLSQLSKKEIVDLFEKNFVITFKLEFFNLWDKIEIKLISIPFVEDRDIFKKEIREALLKNKENFTGNIVIYDDKKYKPTVSNWLLFYNKLFGTASLSRLQIAQFLSSNVNIKKLSVEEREKLRGLILVYEKLKLSSLIVEGFENDIPVNDDKRKGVIRRGIFYPEDQKAIEKFRKKIKEMKDAAALEKVLKPLEKIKEEKKIIEVKVEKEIEKPVEKKEVSAKEKILTDYFSGQLEQKVIYNFEREIINETNKDPEKIKLVFKQALDVPEREKVIAALKILVQINELQELIIDEKIGQGFIFFLSSLGETISMDDLKRLSNSIKYTSLLLQYILKNRLGLNENDSAKIGVQFSNILSAFNKDFRGMVYFNADKGEFKWS